MKKSRFGGYVVDPEGNKEYAGYSSPPVGQNWVKRKYKVKTKPWQKWTISAFILVYIAIIIFAGMSSDMIDYEMAANWWQIAVLVLECVLFVALICAIPSLPYFVWRLIKNVK